MECPQAEAGTRAVDAAGVIEFLAAGLTPIRRVDAALRRERRTSADIAHELRTPIAELLTAAA